MFHYIYVSGVARVPCALGQGIILRPLSTKTTKFEVKNKCKSAEEAKTEHQPPEANGGSGAEPSTPRRFFSFFKKYAFLSILWSKFLLKTRF